MTDNRRCHARQDAVTRTACGAPVTAYDARLADFLACLSDSDGQWDCCPVCAEKAKVISAKWTQARAQLSRGTR